MRRVVLLACLSVIILGGCKGSPAEVSMRSGPELQASNLTDIAWTYGMYQTPALGEELRRRGTFSEEEWKAIHAKAPYPGMKLSALYACLGRPEKWESMETAEGKFWRLKFTSSNSFEKPVFVNLKNDKVVAIFR